jgi:UDP-galactose transporter B1
VTSTFKDSQVAGQFFVVALSTSLASPFGYAALRYIDYPTMILGKSSKLLSVMFVHLVLYRSKFPPHKFFVVAMVTTGVALFTFFQSHEGHHVKASTSIHGLGLLFVNLILDGFTNSTQDVVFKRSPQITGPHMMFGFNLMATALNVCYLLSPLTHELHSAATFMREHPAVLKDIIAFSICGSIGQIFIFKTLRRFGSLVLVTITLTRKILTMLLSVVWFGHSLLFAQWVGVGLVFGGIGLEAFWAQNQKRKEAQSIPLNSHKHENENGGHH